VNVTAVVLAAYTVLLLGLIVAGRRRHLRAAALFLPDCIVLFGRLARDPAVSWPHRLALAGLLAYIAFPLDLIPDFIPLAGQLDDALIALVVLRLVLRGAPPERLAAHWPGPPASLGALRRLAGAT